MSALDLLEQCLNAVTKANSEGQEVNDYMNELQDLSLEISEKLNRIYAYLTPKLNRIISKYSYKYNLLPLVSQNRNFGSNSANSEKKSTFNELIEMCDKIEIAYQKSQRVVEQNSSNISNVDTIAGKLETMAVMNRKARVVRQRQALSVGEARRTLSQLKTMHSKVSDLFEGIVFESSPKTPIQILDLEKHKTKPSEAFSLNDSVKNIAESTQIEYFTPNISTNHQKMTDKKVVFADTTIPLTNPDYETKSTDVSADLFSSPNKSKPDQKSSIIDKSSSKDKSNGNEKKSPISQPSPLNIDSSANHTTSLAKPTFSPTFSLDRPVDTVAPSKIQDDPKNLISEAQSSLKPFTFNNQAAESQIPTSANASIKPAFSFNLSDQKNNDLNLLPTDFKQKQADSSSENKPDNSKPFAPSHPNLNSNEIKTSKKYHETYEKIKSRAHEFKQSPQNSKEVKTHIQTITKFVNQISRHSGIELIKNCNALIKILQKDNFKDGEMKEDFVVYISIKCFMNEIHNSLTTSKSSAFPLATVLKTAMVHVPCFYSKFISVFMIKFPLINNSSIPTIEELKNSKNLKMLIKSTKFSNKSSNEDIAQNLSTRYENALFLLSLLISIPKAPISANLNSANKNVLTDSDFSACFLWKILVNSIKSMKNSPDISCTIIQATLTTSGKFINSVYSKQFEKIMKIILTTITKISDDKMLSSNGLVSKMKIMDMCEHFESSKSFKDHEGCLTNDFWKS